MNIRSVSAGGSHFLHQNRDTSLAILNVQHALNELAGLKVVPEDGMFGTETSNAILNFQRAHQIPGTGQIDDQTIDAIHVALYKKPGDTADLTQSKFNDSSGVMAPPLNMISDAYSISVRNIHEQWTAGARSFADVQTSLQSLLDQAPQNAVASSGAALGYSVLNSMLPSLLQHPTVRVPLAQFSSQLEAVLLRNSTLSAPQLIAFAENAVALLQSVLPIVKQLKSSVLLGVRDVLRQIHLTNPSFLPLSGFIRLPGAEALHEAGDTLATLLTGAACRQAPISQILQSPAFAGILSTFSLAAAVPFAGASAGIASFVHSAAFTGALLMGFMNHLPEMLMNSDLDGFRIGDLVEALPARWFLLSLTVTTVTMSVMVAVSHSAVEINQREATMNLRKAVAASVEMEASAEEAISALMKQTVTNCEQMISAVARATEVAGLRSVLHQGGFLPAVDPKIATGLQGIMQRILGTICKINESSRRLLLLAEGI